MKCSHCQGPLRVSRTRLNGKPVWERAVSEERLKALENVAKAARTLVNTTKDMTDADAYIEALSELERFSDILDEGTQAEQELENARN